MLIIERFIFSNFEENTYLVTDKATGQAAIIDPGMLYEEESQALDRYIREKNVQLTQIILTHAHLDHCFGAEYVKNKYGVPLKGHREEVPLLAQLPDQARRFGMGSLLRNGLQFDVTLTEDDVIELGESRLKVIHMPGHSRGGIALYDEEDKVAFVGDSIFRGSIGRTDLMGGDFDTLIKSIKDKIFTLPDDTILLSGHGDPTTVGEEKRLNPFFRMG